MQVVCPENVAQLQDALREAQQTGTPLEVRGAGTKLRQAGPLPTSGWQLETKKLNRVLAYDPRDLTISVEAGLPWRDLEALLAEKGQMVALNPGFTSAATVGGVLAANTSGSWRRLYGTARDLTIGLKFATLNGRLVESGGMVVKNVAGLDFAKLMIGSFGTLGVIATANFKLMPKPPEFALFLLQGELREIFAQRNTILQSVLQPLSLDVLNPTAAQRLGLAPAWTLLVEAAGSTNVIARYRRELSGFAEAPVAIGPALREFTSNYLADHPHGFVVRRSTRLQEMEALLQTTPPVEAVLARAGNGVTYQHTPEGPIVPPAGKAVVDFSPSARPPAEVLWPAPGEDFFLMERIKGLFDPARLLNPWRLYARL
ncbi:MAG: FAD-binding oxidoreductase [Bryobacter sp.]|nr:FAD-binding oxidoreductase [Bryobacter sp.]